jgi:intergrase/recombinase
MMMTMMRMKKLLVGGQNSCNFSSWLQLQGKTKNTIKQTVNYAKRFASILDSGDASSLMTLSPRNRHHAMTACANLSKFVGCYDDWLQIRQRYSLKWTTGNESFTAMQRFFDTSLTIENMIAKVKRMIQVLPVAMATMIKFNCLTGLRPSEAVESVRLLRKFDRIYYNEERQCLEHFRLPDIFLRATKKAYISFVTADMLKKFEIEQIKQIPTYNAIRLACRKRGIMCDMQYCRKIHGSWLHSHGISSEDVDFLHGRSNPSVFSRHYLSPSVDLKDRVLLATEALKYNIDA